MARQFHRHLLRDPGPDEVAHRRPPGVVRDTLQPFERAPVFLGHRLPQRLGRGTVPGGLGSWKCWKALEAVDS